MYIQAGTSTGHKEAMEIITNERQKVADLQVKHLTTLTAPEESATCHNSGNILRDSGNIRHDSGNVRQ